jgi:hypothetical protein
MVGKNLPTSEVDRSAFRLELWLPLSNFKKNKTIDTRGVCRIGLTSLNPMVCLSSQSESDLKMKKAIRSEKMFIKSDPMLKFVIQSELKLLYTTVYGHIFS